MGNCIIRFNDNGTSIASIKVYDMELCNEKVSLFDISLLDEQGNRIKINAYDAVTITDKKDVIVFGGYPCGAEVTVSGYTSPHDSLHIVVKTPKQYCVEWVDFPRVALKPLIKNGGVGKMLFPYNEGALVDDINLRESSGAFRHHEASYPSEGCFAVFPNMVFAQFMAYITDFGGLYYGIHDAERGVKQIDFHRHGDSVVLQCKTYSGLDFGQCYRQWFPVVLQACGNTWEDAAECYRVWVQNNMPEQMPKIRENHQLPDWYRDSPLIVTYPVRGIHDMDEMTPNRLFPYCNALPLIQKIADDVGSKLLVLLMHWEGTAPWAPPYVWPPYGGQEPFEAFRNALHKEGHLLGVYCSGFGYTMYSNLTDYSGEEEYTAGHYEEGMCTSPKQTVDISHICTGQRQGYDICPSSSVGKEILNKAYTPLFGAGIDYAQILDQNHGGGQYFCYGRNHGHPAVPGAWMTKNMQSLLKEWNEWAGTMLLGCESSAAEPFIPHLLFSDNRYELNFHIGQAVPLYAYLYHEYVRNFMGNQVSCPFAHNEYTLAFRLAYSFVAGDAMALVLTPNGELMTNWGDHDFTDLPDYDTSVSFVATLQHFYQKEAQPWLFDGKMIKPLEYTADDVTFHSREGKPITVRTVISTAWEKDGKRAQIFVNHTENTQIVYIPVLGSRLTLISYSAQLVPLPTE